MDPQKRIKTIMLINKIKSNKEFADSLGLKVISRIRKKMGRKKK